jgi:hypothetical protein
VTKTVAQVRTILLVFAATILGLLITGGVDLLSLNGWSDWRPYVTAGIAAVSVYVYKFLSPYDSAYGVGSK